MLLQFSVSNYRCFRTLQTLNLQASGQDKSLPDNVIERKLPGVDGKRWLKGVALYGANASGKSTLLDALRAFQQLVQQSAQRTDPKEPIPQVEPFGLCPGQPEVPTAFAVAFVTQGVRYEYRVAATRERIWHESLRAFPKTKEQLWFHREWSPDTGSYAWSPERPSGFKRDPQLESYTLPNVLFLSKAIASNRPDLEPVFRFFTDQLVFRDLSGGRDFAPDFTLRHVAERTAMYPRIVELLRHADLGVLDARAVEGSFSPDFEHAAKLIALSSSQRATLEQLRKKLPRQPELTHRGSAGEVALPWSVESAGTQRFFALAGPWLDILRNGSTVCIDELETSLHPLMLRALLELMFSASENPNGAQILFTTHNPLLLDATLLRRDQVWFTDKDEHGAAHLYPLTDYQPRKGESLVRGYLSGRYGAVPFLPEGLLGTFAMPPAKAKPHA